jgi:hypothetical protein
VVRVRHVASRRADAEREKNSIQREEQMVQKEKKKDVNRW